MFVTCEHPESPQADPASHDPSEARSKSRDVPRQPDPTDRYMLMLDRLVDLGMELTEDLVAESREAIAARRAARAAATPAAVASPEPAAKPAAEPQAPELTPEERAERHPAMLAFHRMTRAVRLSMALAVRLYNDRLDREQGIVRGRAAGTPRKSRLKAELERRVKEVIEREAEPSEREGMERALYERLEKDDFERALDRCSPDELVELAEWICREIGIGPDGDFGNEEDGVVRPAVTERRYPHPDNPDIIICEIDIPNHDTGKRHPWERRRKRPSG